MPDTKPVNQTQAGQSDAEKAYMDANRFPLTTQPGLTFSGQRMIDAVNRDDLQEMRDHGDTLDAKQEAIWLELEAKTALRKSSAEGAASGR